jgi:hypothetical protein
VNTKDKIDLLNGFRSEASKLPFNDKDELDRVRRNGEMLIRNIFNATSHYLRDFSTIKFYPLYLDPSQQDRQKAWESGKTSIINLLTSMIDELRLFGDNEVSPSKTRKQDVSQKNQVFVVHGHDEPTKTKVARFIEKLGLKAIILHEQANQGRTIIQKFEDHAATSCFAVVLLTPDDEGYPVGKNDEAKLRARQNVIFELGYFNGVLGRSNVCVLYKEGVEIPNDYLGVVYTPLDNNDAWKLLLAREMKQAGIQIDMNKVID